MMLPRRIRTIYCKELADILRDRRTLIAMILVPIVLYPLLMLGSVQAISYQVDELHAEKLVLGVVRESDRDNLISLIRSDAAALAQEEAAKEADQNNDGHGDGKGDDDSSGHHDDSLDSDDDGSSDYGHSRRGGSLIDKAQGGSPTHLGGAEIAVFDSADALSKAIRDRRIQAGVLFANGVLVNAADKRNDIELLADWEEVRSRTAAKRITAMLDRIAKRTIGERLARANLPESFADPFDVTTVDLSAPSSILGQVLPLILILMTITGAIYPAIDLTAGERERGTLESLMVCPVPVIDLIVGKFLVVTTVAIMGATLNLASVSATVYFGGFDRIITQAGGVVPVGKMVFILLALIPFAVLMSAIMIAVCSFARSFKEAQNYVTPVILAVLIPGGIAALPATRLEGIMLVMPVANMVLLARELLLGAVVPLSATFLVLLSTTLYAASAVAVAASLFGKESVVFADSGSLRSALSRRFIRPRGLPSVSMVLLFVAILFPVWFFVQSALSPGPDQNAIGLLRGTGIAMPVFFLLLPLGLLVYRKVDAQRSLCLRTPELRYVIAAILIGCTAWIPVHELSAFQQMVLPIPGALRQSLEQMQEAIATLHPAEAILLLALIPALCEEIVFRGFLLSGLTTGFRRRSAIVISAVVFGVFHFALFKFATATALGLVLGYLCIRSRSILPGIIAHALHNGLAISEVYWPWRHWLGITTDETTAHLPAHLLMIGGAVFIAGLLLPKLPSNKSPRPVAGVLADSTP